MAPRAAVGAGWAGLGLLLAALNLTPISNNDIFLHLTTGRIVLESGRVPRVDDYSALAAGRPYIAHEWLAAILFHLVERAGGLDLLIVFKVLVAIAVAAALYAAARALEAPPAAAFGCLGFVMILAAARFLERPHIFTCLLTAIFVLLLTWRRAGRHVPAWAFLILQGLWANLHGGFVLGPALVAMAGLAALLDVRLDRGPGRGREAARLLVLSVALVVVCLVNPYGASLLVFPFALTGSAFMEQIYEWQPTFSSAFVGTYMLWYYVAWSIAGTAALALALTARLRRGRPLPGGSFPVLMFAALFLLSLRMNRNVTDFALASAPAVAAWIGSLVRGGTGLSGAPGLSPVRRTGVVATLGVAAALTAGAAWFAVRGYAYSPALRRPPGLGVAGNIPVAAADYLEENGVRGNLFNSYAAGAYLVYRLYPHVRVAMDSRNDVYGDALYAEYQRALGDPAALDALLRRLDARAIVLEWSRGGAVRTAAAVHSLERWVLVHFDDTAVVYVRRDGPYAALADRDGYAHLDPSRFLPGRLNPADAPAALDEAGRAIHRTPSYVARAMRADALLAAGRLVGALEEEAVIFAEDPPLAHIHGYLGLIRLRAGDRAGAAARFRRALRLRPGFWLARDGLAEAERPRG